MADALKDKEKAREDAIKLLAAFSGAGLTIPASTILPFSAVDFSEGSDIRKIKQQEALRMFPGADPKMFENKLDPVSGTISPDTIPLNQRIATSAVFDNDKYIGLSYGNDLYEPRKFYPKLLKSKPGEPSPELGSYQEAIKDKTIFPAGDIQAITVTPGPNPVRFAQDYAHILADKLGEAHSEYENFLTPLFAPGKIKNNIDIIKKLENKISVFSDKTPGTAGYVWGNLTKPQYSYAEGNRGLGQDFTGENPSIYISRINADPSKEANYLYTSDILNIPYKEPRSRFINGENSAGVSPLRSGPSWGVSKTTDDIHFRKDLVGARGELTTGDLQTLLAKRNLPFDFQSDLITEDPGDLLRKNLKRLAVSENITPAQAIERFARLVPNIGESVNPPTPAVMGTTTIFPAEGPSINPASSYADKIDLRKLGILPPSDKAKYSPFIVDEFDTNFKYTYPRYGASDLIQLEPYLGKGSSYNSPMDPNNLFDDVFSQYELEINRDKLRPMAANRLLNRTVDNLIEQTKPIKGLGLGGLATGAIATAMDPAVIDALGRGDYTQAGTTAALNTGISSAVGAAASRGLGALANAGYVRPAAAIGEALPIAGGVLAGIGIAETGKALNRVYKSRTGKDWVTRNQPAAQNYPVYTGPTPSIQPRMGKAVLNGRLVDVPYGSLAGIKKVGTPWWDKVGSGIEKFANLLNSGSIIGR